jgi:hypothetical protein
MKANRNRSLRMRISIGFASIACCTGLLSTARARADAPEHSLELSPRDFAYGRVMQLPSGDAVLVQVELPVDVYRRSRTPGLQDVLVFNARGAQVPHALRSARALPVAAPEPVLLPLFPVPNVATPEHVAMAIVVERSAQGEVLRVSSRSAPADQATNAQPIAAYVLDARALPRALLRLRFELSGAPDDLVLPIAVDASSNLVDWRSVPVAGALLHLKHAERSIERAQLEIAPTRAEFFRVQPMGRATFPVTITSISGEVVPEVALRPLARVDAVAQPVAGKSGVYRFDLGGAVPVERIELELPEDNTVIAAEMWSAPRIEGPYQQLFDARFYRIVAAGKSLSGPSCDISRQAVRYYELRVDTTRPALGAGRPRLVTYHAADQLLFLRRGDAPFTLAYGRHAVVRQRFEADDLVALVPAIAGTPAPIATATLLPPAALGGVALLDEPKPPLPYKTYALWAALLAGVALLAGLALRLLRGNHQ